MAHTAQCTALVATQDTVILPASPPLSVVLQPGAVTVKALSVCKSAALVLACPGGLPFYASNRPLAAITLAAEGGAKRWLFYSSGSGLTRVIFPDEILSVGFPVGLVEVAYWLEDLEPMASAPIGVGHPLPIG